MRAGLTALLLATSCDCYQSRAVDSGLGPASDAGIDAALFDAAASEDGSVDAGWRCFDEEVCEPGESFCCHPDSKFAPSYCDDWPHEEVEGWLDCRELPRDLPQVEQSCETVGACPLELPWCCSVVDRYAVPMSDRCVPRPLFGWRCIDLQGIPARDTTRGGGRLTEEQGRRCDEDQPCPEQWPYCCGNLFCVEEPWYGWDCGVR